MNEFDFAGMFDEDYLYFYERFLTPEKNAADAQRIVELLELEPGAEILDCPCGHGRISNALAQRGFRVTGLDQSKFFLERARADAQRLGVDVEYVHGDMRDLPWRGRFGAVVNWFTSFGYFSDDGDRRVLRQFHDVLAPGGRLLLETQNVTRILLAYRPVHFVAKRGDDFMIDDVELDVEHARFVTERIVSRDGQVRKTHFTVRWFSVPELRVWLREAGFGDVRTPGLAAESRLVVVADRPAP